MYCGLVGPSPISPYTFLYIVRVTFLVLSVHEQQDGDGESIRSSFETQDRTIVLTWFEGREYTIGLDDAIIRDCM